MFFCHLFFAIFFSPEILINIAKNKLQKNIWYEIKKNNQRIIKKIIKYINKNINKNKNENKKNNKTENKN